MKNQIPASDQASLRLRGIVVPMVTPLTVDFDLDEAGLARQISRLLAAGVNGLFLLGTSGEGANLPLEQRVRVVEAASTVVDGRVPLLVGALMPSPAQICDFVERLPPSIIDGIVCTTPYYAANNDAEVLTHFRAIRQSIAQPVIAYNIPGATGVRMSPAVVSQLAHERVIAGYKDSGGDELALRRTIEECADLDTFDVLTGSELMVDTALTLGVQGAVPGLANVDPDAYVRLYSAFVSGDRATAKRIQDRLIQLFTLASVARSRTGSFSSGVGGFKAALEGRGIITSRTLAPPLTTLEDFEASAVHEVVAQHFTSNPKVAAHVAEA